MHIPTKARYEYVYHMAAEFICSQNIAQLPADPFKIIATNKWGSVTYKQISQREGMTIADVIESLESPDGRTSYNNRNYCIAYNTIQRIFPRIKFTLFHEIGHIYLEHFLEYDLNNLTKQQYDILEIEANYFASNVMAPSIVIEKCMLIKPQDLCCACGMSKQAANNRLRQFKIWSASEADYKVQNIMQEFINIIKPARIKSSSLQIILNEHTL
jgi:Zn-dependent peptidase ImmA (M78 family)